MSQQNIDWLFGVLRRIGSISERNNKVQTNKNFQSVRAVDLSRGGGGQGFYEGVQRAEKRKT